MVSVIVLNSKSRCSVSLCDSTPDAIGVAAAAIVVAAGFTVFEASSILRWVFAVSRLAFTVAFTL